MRLAFVVAILSACNVGDPPAEGAHVSLQGGSSLVVPTTSGVVRGVANGGVEEFRGIPYAAPPTGELRWRPPAPPPRWEGVRNADAFAERCMQRSFDGVAGSEDCLALNVFRPSGTTPGARLAVMVHFHPGGNAFGSAYRDASHLTRRGVMVVTVGYRLGALGWVTWPELVAEGGNATANLGLQDQIAALRWVHDNVRDFGGDPQNVTIFGMSAGSFDTNAIAASPAAQGLFTRAAIQGTVFFGFQASMDDALGQGLALREQLGCSGAADVLGCMRNAPATAVIQNQDRFFDVLPRVDGVLLPDRPDVLFAENGAPALIIGTDREEDAGGLFDLYGMPAEDWDEFLLSLLGPDLAAMAAELYPFAEYDSPWLAFVTGSTDVNRTCPTRDMALAAAQTAPVYRYLYTHAFERPDDFGFDLPVYRASHAFEEPFLWHDFDGWEYTPSAAEDRLSDIMADYWTNFAKTGNPNGGDLVLWPTYDATTEALLFLDVSPVAGAAYHVPHCAFAQFLYQ